MKKDMYLHENYVLSHALTDCQSLRDDVNGLIDIREGNDGTNYMLFKALRHIERALEWLLNVQSRFDEDHRKEEAAS